jgi:Spy/CpxP family protein refolding chaperone
MTKTIASLLLIAASMFAQGRGGPGGGGPPNPAMMVQRLTNELSLTSAQQQQATTIFTNAQTAESGIAANMQTARQALNAAVTKNDTASIETLATQIGGYQGQMLAIQSKANAALYGILTADQQTKFRPAGAGGFRRPPAQ